MAKNKQPAQRGALSATPARPRVARNEISTAGPKPQAAQTGAQLQPQPQSSTSGAAAQGAKRDVDAGGPQRRRSFRRGLWQASERRRM